MTAAIPARRRRKMIADYVAGMSQNAVARKYGVSPATAHRFVKEAGVSRDLTAAKALEFADLRAQKAAEKAKAEEELELTNGHWMPNSRGIQIWQPCFFNTIQACNINHQENSNAA